MNARLLTATVVGMVLLVALAAADVDGDPGEGFDITDDSGRTFHFDGAAEHIVLNGTGAALTVADAGAVDKIVAVDRYATYGYTGYEQLADMDAVDLGSFYGTSNHDYIVTTLIGLVEAGRLSTDDPILLTSYSSNYELRERLEGIGFERVLIWTTDSVADYRDIVGFVRDVTMIATGEEGDSYVGMVETMESIGEAVSSVPDGERPTAIAIWYSSTSGVMVNNKGIASSMIDLCDAVNIGYDGSKDSWYGDVNTVIDLLADHPGTVIFLPSSWSTAGYTVEDFREDVLNGSRDYTIVQMGALWNNYCPESAEGLMEMATALYPDLFTAGDGGDASDGSGDEDTDGGSGLMAWVAVLAVVVVIGVAAYALFKRTHG